MSCQEKELGNGIGKWKGEEGLLVNLAWGPRMLHSALKGGREGAGRHGGGGRGRG